MAIDNFNFKHHDCKNNFFPLFVAFVCLLLLFGGCSARQRIQILSSQGGETEFELTLSLPFYDYLLTTSQALSGDGGERIFDEQVIRGSFDEISSLTLNSLSIENERSLTLNLSFNSLQELVDEARRHAIPGSDPLFTLTQQNGRSQLRVAINADNFNQITDIFPFLDPVIIERFGPVPGFPYADSEYLEMMEYVLGDSIAGSDSVSELFARQLIEVEVTVSGRIFQLQGGEQTDMRTALFRIPLLQLTTLNTPLVYFMEYQ